MENYALGCFAKKRAELAARFLQMDIDIIL
jgi:hypothetical protein